MTTDFKFGTDTNSLYIENTANNRHVFLKVGEKERKLIFYSKTLNSEGSFIALFKNGVELFLICRSSFDLTFDATVTLFQR